jgi:hypothetical protein
MHQLMRLTPTSINGGGFAFCRCGVKFYGQTAEALRSEFDKHVRRVS